MIWLGATGHNNTDGVFVWRLTHQVMNYTNWYPGKSIQCYFKIILQTQREHIKSNILNLSHNLFFFQR